VSTVSAPRTPFLSAGRRVARVARAAWRMEKGVWVSLFRFVFRRPRVPEGASAFAYHAPVRSLLVILLVLSAIEIPVVDLIVHPWPWVRIPLLIAGIWGVTWMLGLLLGFLTRPHAVGPAGIRARAGAEIDVDLPWELIGSVERSPSTAQHAPLVEDDAVLGPTLSLRMQDEANILITLERPVTRKIRGEQRTFAAVRLWTDDVPGFLAAVRTHIP